LREALGSEIMVHFAVDAPPAITEEVKELARDIGDERAGAEMPVGEATMIGRFGARSAVKEGGTATIAVDTRALHFFDPDSGLGIYDGADTKGAG
ncbi:MAG: ABC transporter ATP-binding protein, partial [Actinomycetota bacterium]|nr:ABC transporter ATP-binding protein [Actinomycetota bacterium]